MTRPRSPPPLAPPPQDMTETGCGINGPGMNPGCAHANGRQPNMTALEYKTEFSM